MFFTSWLPFTSLPPPPESWSRTRWGMTGTLEGGPRASIEPNDVVRGANRRLRRNARAGQSPGEGHEKVSPACRPCGPCHVGPTRVRRPQEHLVVVEGATSG